MQWYLKLFSIFLKLGIFTFGGGYAMIPLIQEEIVERNDWLDNRAFFDTVALVQCLPGALAVNMAVFVGYRLAGIAGALTCAVAVIIPSFTVIVLIALFFSQINELAIVRNAFLGIRPAVVVLILMAVFRLGSQIRWSPVKFFLVLVVTLAIKFLNIHPVIVIVFSILAGFFIFYRKSEDSFTEESSEGEC